MEIRSNVDYIIVGLGLAGIALAAELRKQHKQFLVFEDGSQTSSLVAGGMYNPVILKRFTPVWNAKEQLDVALPFYRSLEKMLSQKFDESFDIYRTFKSVEEQNNWYAASDHPRLKDFMHSELVTIKSSAVISPYRAGKLTGTGRIRVRELVSGYRDYLKQEGLLIQETFRHELLVPEEDQVAYKEFRAGHVVFCEGNGLRNNPYFNRLPLNGTKGELLTIHAPELQLEDVVKAAIFIMPLGDDLYKIGATFNWKDKTNDPTAEGRKELEDKLRTVISCSYKVVDHEAGVRPTTGDRRPLLGVHREHARLAVLNGLGTRGVMIAPLMAQKLVQYLEKGTPLDPDIDIRRFKQKH
jgi:glycine oxidase